MKKNIIIAVLSVLPSLVWAQASTVDAQSNVDNIFAQHLSNQTSACFELNAHQMFTHQPLTVTLDPEDSWITVAINNQVLVVNFEHQSIASYPNTDAYETKNLYFTFAEYASRNDYTVPEEFSEGSEAQVYNSGFMGLNGQELISMNEIMNQSINALKDLETQASGQEGLLSGENLKALACAKELLSAVR